MTQFVKEVFILIVNADCQGVVYPSSIYVFKYSKVSINLNERFSSIIVKGNCKVSKDSTPLRLKWSSLEFLKIKILKANLFNFKAKIPSKLIFSISMIQKLLSRIYSVPSCPVPSCPVPSCLLVPSRVFLCPFVSFRAFQCHLVPFCGFSCLVVPLCALLCLVVPSCASSCLLVSSSVSSITVKLALHVVKMGKTNKISKWPEFNKWSIFLNGLKHSYGPNFKMAQNCCQNLKMVKKAKMDKI